MEAFLSASASRVGVPVSGECLDKLVKYLKLLKKWNARINLVSARDDREIAAAHIVDSLAVVAHLPDGGGRVIDVGSGGGFPGAVIAAVRPEFEITALEPVRKKHAFLSTLGRELGLSNFRPRAERLEQHVRGREFRRYDVAVSRATFDLATWLERGGELVREGGLVLGMEGARQSSLPGGATRHPYELPTDPPRTRAIIALNA